MEAFHANSSFSYLELQSITWLKNYGDDRNHWFTGDITAEPTPNGFRKTYPQKNTTQWFPLMLSCASMVSNLAKNLSKEILKNTIRATHWKHNQSIGYWKFACSCASDCNWKMWEQTKGIPVFSSTEESNTSLGQICGSHLHRHQVFEYWKQNKLPRKCPTTSNLLEMGNGYFWTCLSIYWENLRTKRSNHSNNLNSLYARTLVSRNPKLTKSQIKS